MSDFDEEAERERLREQYERDQKKREATEQMSDLLLKGATMTNAHCDDCGDPIFRYDGREFCPTCQRVVADDADADAGADTAGDTAADADDGTGDAGAGAAAESAGGAEDDTPEHIEVKRPTGPAAAPADAVDEEAVESTGIGADAGGEAGAGSDGAGSSEAGTAGPAAPSGAGHTPRTGGTSPPAGGGREDGEASLSAARSSLVRTLTTQARLAEACEDPRQARDHLEAAREAAETLAALSA